MNRKQLMIKVIYSDFAHFEKKRISELLVIDACIEYWNWFVCLFVVVFHADDNL